MFNKIRRNTRIDHFGGKKSVILSWYKGLWKFKYCKAGMMRASACSIHRQKAKNRAVKDSPYCEGMILLKSFFHLYFETWPLVSVFLLQKNQLVLQYFSAVTQLHSSFPKSSEDLNQKKWEAQRRQQKSSWTERENNASFHLFSLQISHKVIYSRTFEIAKVIHHWLGK